MCRLGVSVHLGEARRVAHSLWPLPSLSSSRSGRTSFYEEYGVIRDVLQNHLTEILTLVAMELPHNVSSSEAVLQHKLQAFQALRGLWKGSAIVGQYQAYTEQVRRELHKPPSFHSLTPTFAGVLWGQLGLRAAAGPPPPSRKQLSTPRCPLVWAARDLTWDFHKGAQWQVRYSFPCLSGLPPA